jgi:glycosyltransferase involved in cell wall biosynthesis
VIRTRHVVTPLKEHVANRWLAKRTAAMVVVSNAVEKDVSGTSMYGTKTHFIPGGIDLELFHPTTPEERLSAREKLKLDPSALIVICVARFAIVKAHGVLLEAWADVQKTFPQARLVLVGGGHLMDENIQHAKALGLENSVIFAGKRDDVPELISAANIGVLSSIGSEGFSRAVLEYMAKGLPVVGTKVGAVPDLVDPEITGKLVEPNQAQALSEALKEVLGATSERRAELGRAGRQKAAQGYGFDAWAQKHEALYESVLNDRY